MGSLFDKFQWQQIESEKGFQDCLLENLTQDK